MPKRSRLTRKDLSALTPKRRIHGELFSVSFSPLPKGVKFTCVVSKKVSAKATERNLVKRRCREVLRNEASTLPQGGYMFTAKRQAAQAGYDGVKADIRELARKLRDSV